MLTPEALAESSWDCQEGAEREAAWGQFSGMTKHCCVPPRAGRDVLDPQGPSPT